MRDEFLGLVDCVCVAEACMHCMIRQIFGLDADFQNQHREYHKRTVRLLGFVQLDSLVVGSINQQLEVFNMLLERLGLDQSVSSSIYSVWRSR